MVPVERCLRALFQFDLWAASLSRHVAAQSRLYVKLRHHLTAVHLNITCNLQVKLLFLALVAGKPNTKQRSGCPVSVSLEVLGDRWSLLIIRDLMVRGLRTFREFRQSGEGISTNILASRLRSSKRTESLLRKRVRRTGEA